MTVINCDMGESFGLYQIGDDAALMPLISLANVACGFHGSDYNHMRETVRLAKRHGVKVGAHPSLPDLQGFGRREMKMPREELANCMIYQIGALKGFLDAEGMALNHIKPHGALYGMASRMEEVAHAVCDAADVFGVPIIGMTGHRPRARLQGARPRLHRGVLRRPRLQRRRQPDHHPQARCGRPGRCGGALAARHQGGQDQVGRRQGRGGRRRCDLHPFRHAQRRGGGARGRRGGAPLPCGGVRADSG